MCWAPTDNNGCHFGHHCCQLIMNLENPHNEGLGQYMCKAPRPLGSVDSLNPHRWKGKWLHHHGGYVCCVFVLCVAVSFGH
jgi:hypothetical protein